MRLCNAAITSTTSIQVAQTDRLQAGGNYKKIEFTILRLNACYLVAVIW